LTDTLRSEAAALLGRVQAQAGALPSGTLADVDRIVGAVRLALDRLDQVADQETDRIAAPERLADAAEILRIELPLCLDTYLGRAPSTPEEPAARELGAQLKLVVARADRLVGQVPDVHVRRAEELTREMRRRHGQEP
jgi:D-serine deaminase-like pyridoxal phosphate-dependent protein